MPMYFSSQVCYRRIFDGSRDLLSMTALESIGQFINCMEMCHFPVVLAFYNTNSGYGISPYLKDILCLSKLFEILLYLAFLVFFNYKLGFPQRNIISRWSISKFLLKFNFIHQSLKISTRLCRTFYRLTHALEHRLIFEWCYNGVTCIMDIRRLHILHVIHNLIVAGTETTLALNSEHHILSFHRRIIIRHFPSEILVSLVQLDILGQFIDCIEPYHFPVVLAFYNAHYGNVIVSYGKGLQCLFQLWKMLSQ